MERPDPWDVGWWRYRVPGLGQVDWRRVVDTLYEGGFDAADVAVTNTARPPDAPELPVAADDSYRVAGGNVLTVAPALREFGEMIGVPIAPNSALAAGGVMGFLPSRCSLSC